MIRIDNERCSKCGICLSLRGNYCLHGELGRIRIDGSVCNECGECIAICPVLAFSSDDGRARTALHALIPDAEGMRETLMARKSIRHFTSERVDRDELERVVEAGRYAPTMNHGIEVVVVDDPELLSKIDVIASAGYEAIYRILFARPVVLDFIGLFSKTMGVVKRKLEHSIASRRVLYGAPALILLVGDPKVPISGSSAQYHMYSMLLYSASAGLGACLMDSVKVAFRMRRSLYRLVGIPRNRILLGALVIGRPAERILNVNEGLSLRLYWNGYGRRR